MAGKQHKKEHIGHILWRGVMIGLGAGLAACALELLLFIILLLQETKKSLQITETNILNSLDRM